MYTITTQQCLKTRGIYVKHLVGQQDYENQDPMEVQGVSKVSHDPVKQLSFNLLPF